MRIKTEKNKIASIYENILNFLLNTYYLYSKLLYL